jgi:hypothetical protein
MTFGWLQGKTGFLVILGSYGGQKGSCLVSMEMILQGEHNGDRERSHFGTWGHGYKGLQDPKGVQGLME